MGATRVNQKLVFDLTDNPLFSRINLNHTVTSPLSTCDTAISKILRLVIYLFF